MSAPAQHTVLLGVTGSIAAYKACELTRLLQKAGVRVKVVMTQNAQELVGAATLRALSGEPVATQLFDDPGAPVHHVSLAAEADAVVIAPCTANVLNKLARGIANDLLTTTVLASTAPLIVAPAMNVNMLQNERTQEALALLEAQGTTIVGPGEGYLACGEEAAGRMAEPAEVCAAVCALLKTSRSLAGKKVLITAGPTREFLDPVRFISSPSSGRTGFALAREAARRGASVTLVSGPVHLITPAHVQRIDVTTAEQMLARCSEHFDDADIAIFSAAVADFRPAQQATQKLKKNPSGSGSEGVRAGARGTGILTPTTLELTENPDILATLAHRRNAAHAAKPYVVGFAAETNDVLENARAKLTSKGADLIVANDVSQPEQGFGSVHNKLYLLSARTPAHPLETSRETKEQLARIIFDFVQQE